MKRTAGQAARRGVSGDADCAGLAPCGAANPCEDEGREMDELDNYTMRCTELQACGGSFCMWDGEACMLDCRTDECSLSESFPAEPICE